MGETLSRGGANVHKCQQGPGCPKAADGPCEAQYVGAPTWCQRVTLPAFRQEVQT